MEVLVAEDDAFMSLEEALAFIDGYDATDLSLTETLTQSSLLGDITPVELLTPKAATVKHTTRKRSKPQRKPSESSSSADDKPTKKARIRSAASSSTRLQQRKRAEIQALREQAQELEAQVELLKKNRFLPADVTLEVTSELKETDDGTLVAKEASQNPPANWHEMDILQYRERLVSEKTNRRLKSILKNQENVNAALSGLLQKRSVLTGMEFVLAAQPETLEPSLLPAASATDSVADDSKEVLVELEKRVYGLYKKWRTKFCSTTQSPVVTCDMQVKQDAQRGKVIKFITTTPMSCSVRDASEILWKELTTCRDHPNKVYKHMKGTKPNSHEMNFVMSARSPFGVLELNGLQYMEKFEETERTVFVVAERMTLASKNLKFRDECWMTVTPSSIETNASVVELHLQLYMERDVESQLSPEDVSYAQDRVIGSLGNAFRKFFQAQQNTLMEKAGRAVLSSSSSSRLRAIV